MCFAIPLRIIKKDKDKWLMEDGRVVKTELVGKVRVGDYLVCQHDMAVDKLTKTQAQSMRRAIKGVSDELSKRS